LKSTSVFQFTTAVSFETDACDITDVEIDDFTVRVSHSINKKNQFITLFTEDFERFVDGRFPKNSGWISKEIINQGKDFAKDTVDCISVQSDSINENKSLKINNSERNPFIVVKHFNTPENFPFDTSDRPFEIRYNEDMEEQNSHESVISRNESKPLNNNLTSSTSALTSTLALENKNTHGPNTGDYLGGFSTASSAGMIQSPSMVDTYYIYSFDGKLMAEYDHNGNCVKDYIYAGNRLIAEYQPQVNKYYYYMSDQINSTRIVTDDNGNVVYSEAYGPFGGVQKNWTKAYDPKLKFSGKEREAYSDLDYFGARYYDHNSYRFISTDPVINREEALYNPQLWNLYSYCRNNPITFMDTDGRRETIGDSYYKARDRILRQYGPQAAAEFEAGYMTGMKHAPIVWAAALAGYFAPEIIAASAPLLQKAGQQIYKFARITKGTYKKALDYALKQNKMNHLFRSNHNLDALVQKLGTQENVIRAVISNLGKLPKSGVFEVTRTIKGIDVVIRGNVIDEVPKIGTIFIK